MKHRLHQVHEPASDQRDEVLLGVGKQIEAQITERTGLVPLAWFERGPRELTSNRPIKTPDDKTLRLHALAMREYLEALGDAGGWDDEGRCR